MDVFNSKKTTIVIDITSDGDYSQLEDEDVIEYSLYDLNGDIVYGIDSLSLDPSDFDDKSKIAIEIPAEANVIGEGGEFANRLLIVNYTVAGISKEKRTSYRIVPFVPYVCNKDDVRNTLGVSSTVIEDDMVDLYKSYLKSKSLFDDESFLDECLKSSGLKNIQANRIIVINAALSFRSSLMLMTPKIESDSVVSQTRFTMSAEDFEKLFDNLNGELQDLISELLDEDVEDSYSPELFIVGDLTDTFTGA